MSGADRLHAHVLRRYGLTPEDYLALLDAQGGVCAACLKPETMKGRGGKVRRLAVDHCHRTGEHRWLLCGRCNQGLGMFLEDATVLRRMADMLDKRASLASN